MGLLIDPEIVADDCVSMKLPEILNKILKQNLLQIIPQFYSRDSTHGSGFQGIVDFVVIIVSFYHINAFNDIFYVYCFYCND